MPEYSASRYKTTEDGKVMKLLLVNGFQWRFCITFLLYI